MKIKLSRRDAWWSKDEEKYLSIKVYGDYGEVEAIHNAVLEAIAKIVPKMANYNPQLIVLPNKKARATED